MKFSLAVLVACFAVCQASFFHTDNTCDASIIYHRGRYDPEPGIKMNFRSQREENWNQEILSDVGTGVDSTSERVDGGLLQSIEILPMNKVCLKAIVFVCGPKTNQLYRKRSIFLDAHLVLELLARKEVAWNEEDQCLWMSNQPVDVDTVMSITVHADAFNECAFTDLDCIRGHTSARLG